METPATVWCFCALPPSRVSSCGRSLPFDSTGVTQKLAIRSGVLAGWQWTLVAVTVLEKGLASRYFRRRKSGNSCSAPLSPGGREGCLEPEEALQEASEVGQSADIKTWF